MNTNYNNIITEAIDAQLVIAPQYGIMGTPPKFDPPPQKRSKRSGNRGPGSNGQSLVRQQRTKDLKVRIAVLEAELALVHSGKMPVQASVEQAMEARLQLVIAEKTRRDLRDLANGKTAPSRSFYSLGARARRAA